ncbi:MAG TPA: type II CAAX endopeptidase family protein [Verrucomicrobiae bacterium]|nr:type II CAAX endopeptidase family protein [Verrucomicrobiae bacterium]
MRASKAIGLYAIAVIVIGALFAPWLFWAVQWAAPHIAIAHWLAGYGFHRVFNRSLLIVALVGLWSLLRSVGVGSCRELGFIRTSRWWRHGLLGFALGIGSFSVAIAISCALGNRSLAADKSVAELAVAVLRYTVVGLVVALIEETFFRGGIQGVLQRGMNVVLAIVLASAIYSVLHFLKPRGADIASDQVTWTSGFAYLGEIARHSFAKREDAIGFVTLFLAGCILGLAYARTRALYLSIGLHAGWVLANELARWLDAGTIVEDMTTWLVLALLLVIVGWLCTTQLRPLPVPDPSGSGRVARST